MLNNIDIFRKLYPGKSEKGESYVEIDNHVFQLHYKGTVMLLLAMTMLVTMNQLIEIQLNAYLMESQFLLQTRFVFFMEPTLSKTPCWYFWYFEN